jgi:hypothetical protein
MNYLQFTSRSWRIAVAAGAALAAAVLVSGNRVAAQQGASHADVRTERQSIYANPLRCDFEASTCRRTFVLKCRCASVRP